MADEGNNTSHRLTSWKEIAAHLGRSVRTVQRWEHELGLPVHRLEGKARDIIHAVPHELDAWLEEHSHRLEQDHEAANGPFIPPVLSETEGSQAEVHYQSNGKTHPQTEGDTSATLSTSKPLPYTGSGIWLAYGALALALLFGARFGYQRLTATPADYRVEGHDVIVVDESGRELWRHTFDFPLSENDYARTPSQQHKYPPSHLAVLRDLDGDGRRELLFGVVPAAEHQSERALLCFDHKGRILWRYQPDHTVHYGDHHRPGDHHFEPPYAFGGFYLFPEGEGMPDAVWATFSRAPWFPNVIVKLNAEGELLGEYWHAGAVSVLAKATLVPPAAGLAGRRVLLAGAYSNEHHSPALSVLDYEKPTGFSPATDPAYRCENCPPGSPLAYVRFPRSELSRALEAFEGIAIIRRFGNNALQITTQIATEGTTSLALTGYYFDQDLRLVDVTIGPNYAALHNRLMTEGILDHQLDLEKEQAELGTPLYWNGKKFTSEWAMPGLSQTAQSRR